MSYRAGIQGWGQNTSPRIICDLCNRELPIPLAGNRPPAWFLNKKPPPSWTGRIADDGTRRDYCSTCKVKP